MSLYDDASLIMYPSGYKEDKIYSLKPTNGTGDLTFSRASSATRVNAEGLIEEASVISTTEEVTNGNFATDSDWTKETGWSIVGGNLIATSVSGTAAYQVGSGLVSGKKYQVQFEITEYTTGAIGLRAGTGATLQTFSSIGVHYADMVAGGALQIRFDVSGTTTLKVDNVSVKEVITSNIPRIDYTNGCGSLLLEKQSTNLITYSESFDNAAFWALSNSASITSNNVTSPDGTLNADTLVAGASSSQVQGAIVGTSGAIYTVSMYIKRISGSGTVYLRAVENANTPITVTTEWTRVYLTVTSTATTIRAGVALATSGDQVAIYGAQLEQSSYPTSYIPTSGTSTTRIKDTASKTGLSSVINSTEGVLYAEIKGFENDAISRAISISDGTTSNRINLFFSSNQSQVIGRVSSAGVTVADMIYTGITQTTFNKIAVKYKVNDFALWVNGVEVLSDLSGAVPTGLNQVSFDNAATAYFYGNCQNLMVFPSALTDDELADLTGAVHQTFNSLATFYNYTIL